MGVKNRGPIVFQRGGQHKHVFHIVIHNQNFLAGQIAAIRFQRARRGRRGRLRFFRLPRGHLVQKHGDLVRQAFIRPGSFHNDTVSIFSQFVFLVFRQFAAGINNHRQQNIVRFNKLADVMAAAVL